MIRPWLEFLGVDLNQVPEDAPLKFTWAGALEFPWNLVLVAAAVILVLGVVQLYRREIDTCPPGMKWFLAALRIAAFAVLLLILLKPAFTYSKRTPVDPYIVVLRDRSESMNLADRYQDDSAGTAAAEVLGAPLAEIRDTPPTRVQLVNHLLEDPNLQLLDRLRRVGRVRVIDFAEDTEEVALLAPHSAEESAGSREGESGGDTESEPGGRVPGGGRVPPLAAGGRGTNLAQALREALRHDPVAAIVMFTEGQHTAAEDPKSAAQLCKEHGVPVLVVGVGDPSRDRNVRVDKVYARPQVWPGEPFEVQAVLRAQGIEGGALTLKLLERPIGSDGQPGPGSLVRQQDVRIPDQGGLIDARFTHTAGRTGRYVYTVEAAVVDGERRDDDNLASSPEVVVLDRQKIRVLLIAGAPTWEYRLVSKLLIRDRTSEVSCWLQSMDPERAQDGDKPIQQLPKTRPELFEHYDVVLLFDPNPEEFSTEWIELLKEFASRHSGGVLYQAGPKFTPRFLSDSRTSNIRNLLPVYFGESGASEVAGLVATNTRAWPLRIMLPMDHPVMAFSADREASLARWESLPGIYWSYPATGPKPASRVLLEHSDPTLRRLEGSRPLMVAGRYGSGHTLYLGFNGTWRWRSVGGGTKVFDDFWIQTINFLMEGRSLADGSRGSLQADRDRYEIGQQVTVTARLWTPAFDPLEAPTAEALLTVGREAPQPLTLQRLPDQPGVYEARFTTRATGGHSIALRLDEADGSPGPTLTTDFQVELPTIEQNQVWLDKARLQEIAEESGGSYYEVNQVGNLPEAVPDLRHTIVLPGSEIPLWDSTRVSITLILVLVGLLSLEWGLRKAYRLL